MPLAREGVRPKAFQTGRLWPIYPHQLSSRLMLVLQRKVKDAQNKTIQKLCDLQPQPLQNLCKP